LYLGLALIRLNRFTEAREVLEHAIDQNIVHPEMRSALYQLAHINGDAAEMQQQIDWARGRPDEYIALEWQADAAAFSGHWRRTREHARRSIDLATRAEAQEIAAGYAAKHGIRSALFGDCRQARAYASQGLKLTRGRLSLVRAALAFALCGESSQAKTLLDEIAKRFPSDTLINELWLPVIRAALELQRRNAPQAIEQLQSTFLYEAGAEFWPTYLSGQAYLMLKDSAKAASEFQKILDHRGYAPLSPLYPLAHLGLARATQSKKGYNDFLALWKDADAELPLLLIARKEAERK